MNQKLLKIINDRQLVSAMNRTKWRELCEAISNHPEMNPSVRYKLIDSDQLFGFAPVWWDQVLLETPRIEWLEFDPIQREFKGNLVPARETNIAEEIVGILEQYNIPYSVERSHLRVWGWLSDQSVLLKNDPPRD